MIFNVFLNLSKNSGCFKTPAPPAWFFQMLTSQVEKPRLVSAKPPWVRRPADFRLHTVFLKIAEVDATVLDLY